MYKGLSNHGGSIICSLPLEKASEEQILQDPIELEFELDKTQLNWIEQDPPFLSLLTGLHSIPSDFR